MLKISLVEQDLQNTIKKIPKYSGQASLSLKRINLLINKLGNPHNNLNNVIHVAGTNGKGSTVALLTSCLINCGYSVNNFTSPHLISITERIKFNNNNIKPEQLNDILKHILSITNDITIFEALTCAAFIAFNNKKSDFTILETGLGGKLDATNICDSNVALITPISLDHQHYLGNTIAKIAQQKAGIIKKNSICITAMQPLKAMQEITKASINNDSKIISEGEDFNYKLINNEFIFNINNKYYNLNRPSLLGSHQLQNSSLALACLDFLGLDIKSASSGLSKTSWPARLQLIGTNIWFDGAHNVGGAKIIIENIKEGILPNKINLAITMLKNKNIEEFIKILKPHINSIIALETYENKYYNSQEIIEISKKLLIKQPLCKVSILNAQLKPNTLVCGSLSIAKFFITTT